MRPMHQSEEAELRGLQMENELLVHEVRHLRARLAAAERAPEGRRKLEELVRELRGKVRDQSAALSHERKETRRVTAQLKSARAELKRTREDLVWLLGRLDGSPMGPVLRRRDGIRILLVRYGLRESR